MGMPMATRRIHIRPPGVKTGSTVGPFGPFRGTLGIHWVLGSIAVGLVIVLAGSWFMFREPPPPFERVESFTIDELAPGTAREAFAGIFLGRLEDGRALAVTEPPNCPLEVLAGEYVDCAERRYAFDGTGKQGRLAVLPVRIHHDAVYIDTSASE
jgi:hypothetical protein